MASRTARCVAWIQRQAGHPWKWTTCLSIPLADYIFPFLPANTVLISLCAGHPRRWLRFALAFALANAIGAAVIAWLLGSYGTELLQFLFGDVDESRSWKGAQSWISEYGLIILVPLSMLLFPPRLAVAVAGLAGLNPIAIGASVFAGRLFPMIGFALLGARTPNWAKKFTPTRRLIERVNELNDSSEQDPTQTASPNSIPQ